MKVSNDTRSDLCQHHHCLHVQDLSVRLMGKSILENINFFVKCGEILAVAGPNGAGKTTLLRAILNEISYSGKITFCASKHYSHQRMIGYVPQKLHFDLDCPISVKDLLGCSLGPHPVWMGIGRNQKKQMSEILDRVSARHLLNKKIGELSGGELQRVLLALALNPSPQLLLLDEPVSNIDAQGLKLFYDVVETLKKNSGISVVLVTHDLIGIGKYADRVLLLNRSVVALGPAEEILNNQPLIEKMTPELWNISKTGLEE